MQSANVSHKAKFTPPYQKAKRPETIDIPVMKIRRELDYLKMPTIVTVARVLKRPTIAMVARGLKTPTKALTERLIFDRELADACPELIPNRPSSFLMLNMLADPKAPDIYRRGCLF